MTYIYRELLDKIKLQLMKNSPAGFVLSGIVGCGKTTLIQKLLEEVAKEFNTFSFNGDDSNFRKQIIQDTRYLYNEVKGRALNQNKRILIFVDEVQKSEDVFDALKYVFDKMHVSFIVSGSNPAYLTSVARKRLQRRAIQYFMLPISIGEILVSTEKVSTEELNIFYELIFKNLNIEDVRLPAKYSIDKDLVKSFFNYGGLPLSYTKNEEEDKLRQIQLTTERGFELLISNNNSLSDIIRLELAQLHAKEFTYKNILEKTRIRKRDVINATIDQLMNHGYLVKKSLLSFEPGKSSYLCSFSYVDPGIVTYLQGETANSSTLGHRIEGYVHARLNYLMQNSVYKADLGYYKKFYKDPKGNSRYTGGEIDFVFKIGSRIVPIEVKSTDDVSQIDVKIMEEFLKTKKLKLGIVLYSGSPFYNFQKKILYWPYWLI
jgi:predicted AAA+ superfamily ATPase